MSLTPRSILLLIAVILFLLVAFNVAFGTVAPLPLGLAAFAGAALVVGGVWGCGQGIGVIERVRGAAEYVDLLAEQYAEAKARVCG